MEFLVITFPLDIIFWEHSESIPIFEKRQRSCIGGLGFLPGYPSHQKHYCLGREECSSLLESLFVESVQSLNKSSDEIAVDCSDRSNKPKSCSKLCAVSALLTDRKLQSKHQRGGIAIGLQFSLYFQSLLPGLPRHLSLGIQGDLQRKEDREVTLKRKRAYMIAFSFFCIYLI